MTATTFLTVGKYAKKIKKCSRQAVLEAIKNDKLHLLPDVISIQRAGTYYLLEVTTKQA